MLVRKSTEMLIGEKHPGVKETHEMPKTRKRKKHKSTDKNMPMCVTDRKTGQKTGNVQK